MGNSLGRRIAGGIEKFAKAIASGLAAGGVGAAVGSLFGPVGLAIGAATGVIASAAISTANIVHYINSDEEPTAAQIMANLSGDIKNTAAVFSGDIAPALTGLVQDLSSGMSLRGAQTANGITHVPRAIQDGGIRGYANRHLVNGVNPFMAMAIGNGALRSGLASTGKSSFQRAGVEAHVYGSALGLMSSAAGGGGSGATTQQMTSISGSYND